MNVATTENDGEKVIGCCTRFIMHAAVERGGGSRTGRARNRL
jgi:hypothetical protein